MHATRLSVALGAEVTGVDVSAISDADFTKLDALLAEHHVLFLPGQFVTPEAHIALGRRFGPLEGHPSLANLPDHPEIFVLRATTGGIADIWHSDLTFQAEPSVMSILNMVRCPEVGGDTMWANAALAYETLSAPLREMLDGLTALHDESPHGRPDVTAIHPIVRVHPRSGRKVLFVNRHFTRRIVEMSSAESDVLLHFLTDWVTQPRFTVRYRWSEGTLAMWDNRCTQHFVVNDFDGERVIQRVTVMGDRPYGVGEARWEPHRSGRGATVVADQQLRRHQRSIAAAG